MPLVVQVLGLLLLLGGIWFGYRQWIKPYEATLTWQGRGLLLLVVVTLIGGFVGSPFWWMDQPWSFSWDLPPLASRMLAAAGWSFFVLALLALQRPAYRRLRLVLITLVVYLTPLAIVIVLNHMDRFDPTAPITYAFFIIVAPMTVASLWYLLRQPLVVPDEPRDGVLSTTVIWVWLGVVAAVTILWGLAIFITDSGPSNQIWAWSGDLLSSRLIGVMLLTIAAGSAYSMRYADTARLMVAMIIVYSLGITVATLWNMLYGLPVKTLYTAIFGVIFLVSTVLLLSDREPSRRLAPRKPHDSHPPGSF
jgi:hypothetical protein